MKSFIALVAALFSGSKGSTIRIDPDHLPGLRAPKTKPRFPIDYPKPEPPSGTDIDAIYRRFCRSQIGKIQPMSKKQKKGIDFK